MAIPFASATELATYLQTASQAEATAGATNTLDTGIAEQALALASAAIRAVCQWSITQETVTETLTTGWGGYTSVVLPTLYLTDVSATVNGVAVTNGDYLRWHRNGVLSLTNLGVWASTALVITYTHGYPVVPDDVKAVCLELAANSYINPELAISTTVGGVSEVFNRATAPLIADHRLARYVLQAVG